MAKKSSKSKKNKASKYGSARGAKHFRRLAKRGRASLAKRGKYRSQKRGKSRRRAYLMRSKTRPKLRAYAKSPLMGMICGYRTMWSRGQRAGALSMRKKIDAAIKRRGLDPKKVYAANPRCTLTVPERHQLRIARQTLRYPDAMVAVMGGPNKSEAKQIIARLACRGKYAKGRNPDSVNNFSSIRKKYGQTRRIEDLSESQIDEIIQILSRMNGSTLLRVAASQMGVLSFLSEGERMRRKHKDESNPYELFYSSGGHGGPYKNLKEARASARRLLAGGRDRYIEIRDRKDFKTVKGVARRR